MTLSKRRLIGMLFIPIIWIRFDPVAGEDYFIEPIFRIEKYRDILSLSGSDLESIFGKHSIKKSKIPDHDPDTYIDGLLLEVGNHFMFLHLQNDKVAKIRVTSPNFKTEKGATVSNNYCEVLKLYPEASFYIGFDDLHLELNVGREKMKFEFITGDLNLNDWITNGLPERDSKSLCIAELKAIVLE